MLSAIKLAHNNKCTHTSDTLHNFENQYLVITAEELSENMKYYTISFHWQSSSGIKIQPKNSRIKYDLIIITT